MEQNAAQMGNEWNPLFDGSSLKGWRTYQNKPNESWSVEGGVIYCKGSETDKSDMRADLITEEQYENFDFSVEWKIAQSGNRGIMYLVTEEEETAYLTGPEYQLLDNDYYEAELEDWQRTAANYAMNAPTSDEAKPVGEWNHTRIRVENGKVEHWLNGVNVVTYELWSEEWKENKEKGKWKDTPSYGSASKGHIALQDHGSEAWFRNIKIKQL